MKVKPDLSPWTIAGLSVLFYVSPAKLLLPFVLACAVHETAHILCIRLLGGQILHFQLGLLGAELQTVPMDRRRQILCSLAGPGSNLVCFFLLHRVAPCFSLLSLQLGLYNLLLLPPLDGFVILQQLCRSIRLRRGVQLLLLGLLAAGALLLSGSGFGLLPILITAALILRASVEMVVAKFHENE